jgi:NAD(P)H-hydrate repair Nnr-like enzyme with NAD(P)H-hydrate epimerase domain/8-oxo-dGTP pyrophosphatase MutT (NUDIX family)
VADIWEQLAAALADYEEGFLDTPDGGRIGAALALLRDTGDGDLELVFTRRGEDLRSHPGQISLPGGRVEDGESVEEAAVREAAEEIALDPATVTVLGRMPAFYLPPSRFWLQPVVARWDAPHPLTAAEAEVAEVLQVRVSHLTDPEHWRAVRQSTTGWSWAWQLDERHLLWGATGYVIAGLLGLLRGDWSGGTTPQDLPPERRVQPWERSLPAAQAPVPGAPRLEGVEEQPLDRSSFVESPPLDVGAARDAGTAVAVAVRMAQETAGLHGLVTVLVGSGWTGAVGLAAAIELAVADPEVFVVLGGEPGVGEDVLAPLRRDAEQHGLTLRPFTGMVPRSTLVVDALVGRGLEGPLRGVPLEIVHALRMQLPLVVAVDIPSGLHPEQGLVGELLPADVTVALSTLPPGLFRPGLGPFVGDLYVATDGKDGPALVRVVPKDEDRDWRE